MADENGIEVEIIDIEDLKPDAANENIGTPRGAEMIQASIRAYGAGPSGTADKHRRLIAGNKTAEQMKAVGVKEVITVHARPDQWVVVQRDDLKERIAGQNVVNAPDGDRLEKTMVGDAVGQLG